MDINQYLSQLFSLDSLPQGVPGVEEYGRTMGVAAGNAAQGATGVAGQLMGSYMSDYQPYDREFMRYVDTLGSEAYRGQQRAQAMNAVQMQSDMQRQQMERQGAAAGVNYGDPRFAFLRGQMAQQTALNKVMAALGSDRSSRDEWAKGLGAINAMGLKVGELGTKTFGLANDAAKTGLMAMDLGPAARARETNANAAMTSAGAAGAGAAASMHNADLNYKLGLGKLALDRYQIENGIKANSLGNVFGSTLAGAGANWLVNGGLNAIGKGLSGGLSGLFGSGSAAAAGNVYTDYNDFSGVTGNNAMNTWATFGSGGD